MAKDTRKIVHGVRINNEVFTEGREDELAALLSPQDGERLVRKGSLEGEWAFGGKAHEAKPAKPAK